MMEDNIPSLPGLPDLPVGDAAPDAPIRKKRGRPRKIQPPEDALSETAFPVAEPAVTAIDPTATEPTAIEPTAAPESPESAVTDIAPAPELPPSLPPSLPPEVPSSDAASDSSAALDGDAEGREAAKLLRRSLDDMTSSVLQMESLFRSAPPSVDASAAAIRALPAQGPGNKHGKQRGRQPQFPQRQQRQPQIPQQPRKGPPVAAARQPQQPIPQQPAPAAAPQPPQPDLPVIKLADLRGLSSADLLALAKEQRVFEQSIPRRKSDLVFQLAVRHALRGGMVECEGRLELPSQADAAEASAAASAAGASRAEARAAAHNCCLRRAEAGFSPDPSDAVITHTLRDRYGLRPGDKVVCRAKFVPGGPFGGQFEATDIVSVNDGDPSRSRLAPIFGAMPLSAPSRRIRLRSAAAPDPVLDAMDLLAPLAFGQRALLVLADEADARPILRSAAIAVAANHPSARVFLATAGALPEDFPDGAQDRPGGAPYVFCATSFDDAQDRAVRMVSSLLDAARRLVENGRDVVVFLESLPQLLNLTSSEIGLIGRRGQQTGPTEEAMYGLKRLFAAARAIQGGGSLTIVATTAAAHGPSASPQRTALLRSFLSAASAVLELGEDGAPITTASFSRTADVVAEPAEAHLRARALAGEPLASLVAELPPPPSPDTPALPVFQVPQ